MPSFCNYQGRGTAKGRMLLSAASLSCRALQGKDLFPYFELWTCDCDVLFIRFGLKSFYHWCECPGSTWEDLIVWAWILVWMNARVCNLAHEPGECACEVCIGMQKLEKIWSGFEYPSDHLSPWSFFNELAAAQSHRCDCRVWTAVRCFEEDVSCPTTMC